MAKVFVTGHTGFKGTWLCHWLRLLGHDVCGYSLPQNILNKKELESAMQKFKPSLVFHLAAQPLVLASYKEPLLTYQTNVIGTLNVLEAARKCKSVKAFVNVTTDKVYENKENGRAYKETDSLGGHDMYSSSKACSEILSQSYSKSFLENSFTLATARSGNCIGGGDWAENRIVPDCIRAIYANKPIEIRNPNAVRPWQFVLEPLHGYILLGEKHLQGNFNFGPDSVIPVKDIAKKVVKFYGKGKIVRAHCNTGVFNTPQHEANLLMLCNKKAKKLLGWKPKYTIDMALEKTVEWYKRFKAKENMEKFMLCQIEEYMNYE
ncbi:MAG: CDP-glucose 4,6-dehydratase [Fibromonadales bacterium]|nr:CDP-glucose 4,6-dehydratase [Fibromonadales bacterium]